MGTVPGSHEADLQADVRGHETPRSVSSKGAWRGDKVAREPGALAMSSKSERE